MLTSIFVWVNSRLIFWYSYADYYPTQVRFNYIYCYVNMWGVAPALHSRRKWTWKLRVPTLFANCKKGRSFLFTANLLYRTINVELTRQWYCCISVCKYCLFILQITTFPEWHSLKMPVAFYVITLLHISCFYITHKLHRFFLNLTCKQWHLAWEIV